MKSFDNIAEDGNEKAIRRGYSVPEGGVNLAWVKGPTLSPKNNIVVIDSSNAASENSNRSTKHQQLAFANNLGILEDINGNQVWDDEYPIISDEFLSDGEIRGPELEDQDILPYLHVSRHFHIDFLGMTYYDLMEYNDKSIKVVDKNGKHYADADGVKKYKSYITPVNLEFGANSTDGAYRLYIFVDMDPERDELYVTYNKGEITSSGAIRNQVLNYKERLNPRPYYRYVPEESDVIDHAQKNQKIYSSKPVNAKQKILSLPQGDYQGWKYYAPRKALADPRIFQLFRWRLACEYTKPIAPTDNSQTLDQEEWPVIRAGVVVRGGGNHMDSRANFLFYQLNHSDYNFSKIKFVNPTSDHGLEWVDGAQAEASYWHVDIETVTADDLRKFDVLIWAPGGGPNTTLTNDHMNKVKFFTENLGGTFIFETSSFTKFSNLEEFEFTDNAYNLTTRTSGSVLANNTRMYDATPDDITDEFSSNGIWKIWPPNVRDILTDYNDTGSILADAGPIAGWNLTDDEKADVTPFDELPDAKFQYISAYPDDYVKVVEAKKDDSSTYYPILMHKKFDGGGNIFVSTACFFEDHLFKLNGQMATRSMRMDSFSRLPAEHRAIFEDLVSSDVAAAEMKLRLNTFLLATAFRPSPLDTSSEDGFNRHSRQSVTIYSDWQSSWVIDPAGDVLDSDEISEHNFVFQSTSAIDTEPTWQRILSDKTAKQLIDAKIDKLDPDQKNAFLQARNGATQRYMLIVTNSNVQVRESANIADDTIITAWTDAYSPRFEIPYHEGPFVVRDEMVAGTGVGNGRRMYPPKPYELALTSSYLTSTTDKKEIEAKITLTANVKRQVQIIDDPITRRIWVRTKKPGPVIDATLRWNPYGGVQYDNSLINPQLSKHYYPSHVPIGIETWADAHYTQFKANNWPFMGRFSHISTTENQRHPDVLKLQIFLNLHTYFKDIPGPYLKEDGYYGSLTATKVRQFQSWKRAQYVDGIVDAETWSLVGYSLLGFQRIQPGWPENVPALADWTQDALKYMRIENISDGSPHSIYGRQSWYKNGPSSISQAFMIRFVTNGPISTTDGYYRFYQVNIMPWGPDNRVDHLDVVSRTSLFGYDFKNAYPGKLNGKTAPDGQWIKIPFSERRGNAIVFTLSSHTPSNRGPSARHLGLREVAVYAKYQGEPYSIGHWVDEVVDPAPVRTIEVEDTIEYTARYKFKAGVPVVLNPLHSLNFKLKQLLLDDDPDTTSTISSVKWNLDSLEFDTPAIESAFDVSIRNIENGNGQATRNELTLTFNGFGLTVKDGARQAGPVIGNGSQGYYTRTVDGVVDPYEKKYGWITKEDGLKLICTENGKPYGFPTSLPSLAAENIHFARYTLEARNVDQTIYYGLYDAQRQEFIVDADGEPEISYYDYIRRGPDNIFIAVQTTYELDITSNLPSPTDSILRPFKWAMPVYGVTTGTGSKIKIEPLSPDLTISDVWSIPIKTGSFTRSIELKPKAQGSYTHALKDYQGSTVMAYYDTPEARKGPWSHLYGRPYVDVKDETPIILDDNVIQVRQAPILIVQEPTATPSLSDPWVPVVEVFTRDSLTSDWVAVELPNLSDYDVINGIITLAAPLPSNDPRLVKVSYTSEKKGYKLKHDGTNKINLNPFINSMPEWNNKPIYVYMLPEYVMDADYNIIEGTVQTRTLRTTIDPKVLSPTDPEYDPTALLLGMVYISTSFDINDLSVLDTRKRGGGLSTRFLDQGHYAGNNDSSVDDTALEVDSFWDILTKRATSYQKGGFVVIRLPQDIVDDFTRSEVDNAIQRNITLGVRYELENLEGERLEWPTES